MAQLDAEQQAEMERLEKEERKKLKKMLKGDKKYARKRREEKIKAIVETISWVKNDLDFALLELNKIS